jgi:competence protein ComEC
LFSKRVKILVGIIAIVCFALLVGLSATVVRASIMAALLLAAQAFGRTYDVMRGLLLAGAVMIFINPYLLLYDIGFQLSFMATLGLLLVAPHLEVLTINAPTRLGIKDFLVATIATQIAVLPLLLYYIGEVSLVAVVVNVLVLPMVPVAMLLTFITGVVGLVSSGVAAMIGFTAYLSLSYIVIIATWFVKLPFASVTVPVIPAGGIFILYGLLIAILFWRHHKVTTPSTHSEVDDWEVEVETDTKIGGVPSTPPIKDDTPIFFR